MDRSLAASDTTDQGATIQPVVRSRRQDEATMMTEALLTDAQRAQLSQQQATVGERATVSSLADELSSRRCH